MVSKIKFCWYISYNIKLTKVIMTLFCSEFPKRDQPGAKQNYCNNFFPRTKQRTSAIHCRTYVNFIFVNINLGLRCHITHALRKNPFKTLASKYDKPIIYSMWAISTERKQTLLISYAGYVSLSSQRMVPELLTLTLQMS